MSKTSIKERNKAIRLAWEREQRLVQEGKGTRNWTKEQQADILNPDKGKAYDNQGRAFEGQHMKSAAEHQEYQGEPDNIQFLTREEHLEAHKGSWQNPTNWYYDPVIKEYHDFGEGEIIPCKIIELSDPIVILEYTGQKDKIAVDEKTTKERKEEQSATSAAGDQVTKSKVLNTEETTIKSATTKKSTCVAKISKAENGFIKSLKTVGRFIVDHPLESIEIAGVVIGGTIKLVSSVSRSRNESCGTSTVNSRGTTNSPKTDIVTKVSDIVEKATRTENDVSGHKQRYHTKDGVIWKDKAPYHRGGKDR